MVSRRLLPAAVAMLALFVAQPAFASEPLSDRNVRNVRLAVNAQGEALVTYTRSDGSVRRVLAWGAVNARHPDPNVPQVRFSYDYAGGWGRYRKLYWKSFANRCTPYDGPALVSLVAACKASDGSYWALQSWVRLAAMRGFAPFKPEHSAVELHLSHWSGPLATLEVSQNWTYGGSWQGLFGRLTYHGVPVHGFRTYNDRYARFFYIDTYNSRYGTGWKHDAGKAAHIRNGGFCYSFVPQVPPPGYPSREPRGPGNGERHRVTVMGPGVTPVVRWEGPGLGPYDATRDALFNRLFDSWLGGDRVCAPER